MDREFQVNMSCFSCRQWAAFSQSHSRYHYFPVDNTHPERPAAIAQTMPRLAWLGLQATHPQKSLHRDTVACEWQGGSRFGHPDVHVRIRRGHRQLHFVQHRTEDGKNQIQTLAREVTCSFQTSLLFVPLEPALFGGQGKEGPQTHPFLWNHVL